VSPDKEKYLFDTYPELFPSEEERRNPMKSCLAFGFEFQDGWFDLVEDTFKKLRALNAHTTIEQAKEKFGTLRLYLSSDNDEAFNIENDAENLSANICEVCGKPGEMRGTSWLSVRCEEHK